MGTQKFGLAKVFKSSRPRSRPLERCVPLFGNLRGSCLRLLGPDLPPYYELILGWPIWRPFARLWAERPMTNVQSGLEGGFVRF